MAVGGFFSFARRAFRSQSTPRQELLRATKRHPIRRIVEVTVNSLDTSASLLEQTLRRAGDGAVSYTALDPFEERDRGQEPLPLLSTHRRLSGLGARVRLVPGVVIESLAREANSLADTDLLLLPVDSKNVLGEAWFYVPRMCHPGTLVLQRNASSEEEPRDAWTVLELSEVATLSGLSGRQAA